MLSSDGSVTNIIEVDYIVGINKSDPDHHLLKDIRFRVIDVDNNNKIARIAQIRNTDNSIKRSKVVIDRYDKPFSSLDIFKLSRKAEERQKNQEMFSQFELQEEEEIIEDVIEGETKDEDFKEFEL